MRSWNTSNDFFSQNSRNFQNYKNCPPKIGNSRSRTVNLNKNNFGINNIRDTFITNIYLVSEIYKLSRHENGTNKLKSCNWYNKFDLCKHHDFSFTIMLLELEFFIIFIDNLITQEYSMIKILLNFTRLGRDYIFNIIIMIYIFSCDLLNEVKPTVFYPIWPYSRIKWNWTCYAKNL